MWMFTISMVAIASVSNLHRVMMEIINKGTEKKKHARSGIYTMPSLIDHPRVTLNRTDLSTNKAL